MSTKGELCQLPVLYTGITEGSTGLKHLSLLLAMSCEKERTQLEFAELAPTVYCIAGVVYLKDIFLPQCRPSFKLTSTLLHPSVLCSLPLPALTYHLCVSLQEHNHLMLTVAHHATTYRFKIVKSMSPIYYLRFELQSLLVCCITLSKYRHKAHYEHCG